MKRKLIAIGFMLLAIGTAAPSPRGSQEHAAHFEEVRRFDRFDSVATVIATGTEDARASDGSCENADGPNLEDRYRRERGDAIRMELARRAHVR
jgi:hypothetical protein